MVPILRAGIGMLDGVLSLIPGAKVSVVGVARNEETLEAHTYLERLVGELDQRLALIVDPMLATGGSMVAAIDLLKKAGCKEIRALVLVAAPVGIDAVLAKHPDVHIYTASIDDHLNEHGYIVPGLGDAGDRIFGTTEDRLTGSGRLKRRAAFRRGGLRRPGAAAGRRPGRHRYGGRTIAGGTPVPPPRPR